MRDHKKCPKCSHTEIASIPGGTAWNGRPNKLKISDFKQVPIVRYVCLACGFTEEYINDKEGLDRVRKKFFKVDNDIDFV